MIATVVSSEKYKYSGMLAPKGASFESAVGEDPASRWNLTVPTVRYRPADTAEDVLELPALITMLLAKSNSTAGNPPAPEPAVGVL